ncbi:unnamed protein product, partial [Chrysoparadoxa australica]
MGRTRPRSWEHKYSTKCRFCGGPVCLRCSEMCALRYTGAAIKGIHSDWITDQILAMQRPSSRLLEKYNLVSAFKQHGIVAVINLTEPGEHPWCGDGLKSSGFPYQPEEFMQEGISCMNFAWPDMTVPSLSLLADIVRVGTSLLCQGGKIAVHCHAGYGRHGTTHLTTPLAKQLPCLTAEQAISMVREKRPGSVQTPAQVGIVHEFEDFAKEVRVCYHLTPHARVTLGQFLCQQAFVLGPLESTRFRWVPKPVGLALALLEAVQTEVKGSHVAAALTEGRPEKDWSAAQERMVTALKCSANGNRWATWEALKGSLRDPTLSKGDLLRIPVLLLLDWLEQLRTPVLSLGGPAFTGISLKTGAAEGFCDAVNSLPVGEIRTLWAVVSYLRKLQDTLEKEFGDKAGEPMKGVTDRVACSLTHVGLEKPKAAGTLSPVANQGQEKAADKENREAAPHKPEGTPEEATTRPLQLSGAPEGTLEGSADVTDKDKAQAVEALGHLIKAWSPPRVCRPYSSLESIENRPEVHHGDAEYWNKRQSIVSPLDLTQSTHLSQAMANRTQVDVPEDALASAMRASLPAGVLGSAADDGISRDDSATALSRRSHQ